MTFRVCNLGSKSPNLYSAYVLSKRCIPIAHHWRACSASFMIEKWWISFFLGSRAGSWNQSREGLSVFNLLNNCKSVPGSRHLKYLLRCLPREISVIQSRQEAVAFFRQPTQTETLKVMQDALKNVKCITRYLKRLTLNQATVSDWKALKSSLSYMLSLGQLCFNTIGL